MKLVCGDSATTRNTESPKSRGDSGLDSVKIADAELAKARPHRSRTLGRFFRAGHVCGVLVLVAVYMSSTTALAQINVNTASDAICPAAIQYIKALAVVNSTNDPVKIGDLAAKLVRTYNDCTTTARTAGQVEPFMHYAQTRAAQYGILLGRALFLQKDWDGAHAAFIEARRLGNEVAEWTAPAKGYTVGSLSTTVQNTGSERSSFHDLAYEIVRAADVELAKLVPASPSP
jgi:hypothetical protein